MTQLTVGLLGSFLATLKSESGEDSAIKFRTNRVQALLIYLATEQALGTNIQRREVLLDLFWPGMPTQSAQHNLRQTIYQLRKAIPEMADVLSDQEIPFLFTDKKTIQLNPAYPFDFDVARFQQLLRGRPDEWAAATELYRGEFLADFSIPDADTFEDWSRRRREAFQQQTLSALYSLAIHYADHGLHEESIQYAQRQIEIEPLREVAYRQLMTGLARVGRRSEALAIFDKMRAILSRELDIEPDETSQALYHAIYAGDLEQLSPRGGRLGGYELKEQIGAGSFGAVYRATQSAVDREVAIKIILPQFANNADFIRRFETEAQLVARLEHPHIVPLYDYWREPDNAYLVMRWLRGGTLEQRLKDRPLEPDMAVRMMGQISGALESAHQSGIIHRDLKPANILLDELGNGYLSDFGIAIETASPDPAVYPLSERQMSSLSVISPEQIRNEPLTTATDLYSLGVVVYQMMTGRAPFKVESPAALIYKHAHDPLPPIDLLRPDLPKAVNAVIQKATAKQPQQRYGSAVELADAFEHALLPQSIDLVSRDRSERQSDGPLDNPYRGLHPFTESDADNFFGREAMVKRLLDHLNEQPNFLAVVGPSGSGKSSLVKAGLVPALRNGGLPGSEEWFVIDMVPGTHPFEELELALMRIAVQQPPSLLEQMSADPRGLLRAVRRILPSEDSQVVLVIDQFEELFTFVDDPERRQRFLEGLHIAATDPRSPLHIILTLRADFYDRPLLVPDFSELVQDHTAVIVPLTPNELSDAIRRPAELAGLAVEPGLVTRIVADVNEQPGSLPLLQYALSELFMRRGEHGLDLATYEQVGGIAGAIGRRAEELFTNMDERARVAGRQLFLRLITLGEGVEDTRRRARRSELEALILGGELGFGLGSIDEIIAPFSQARLLSFDRDLVSREPTIEVAHEALLREWPRLRLWVDESRDDLRLQRQLATAAAEWEVHAQDAAYLLHGSRLAQYAEWRSGTDFSIGPNERVFLDASIDAQAAQQAAEETRRQRELETARQLAETQSRRAAEQESSARSLRQRAMLLAGVAAVAFVLAVMAGVFGQRSATNEQVAAANAATAVAERMRADGQRDLARNAQATSEAEAFIRATAEVVAEEERDAAFEARATAESETFVRATAEAVAVAERLVAEEQTNLAISRELSQSANGLLDKDPEISVLLAMQALATSYSTEAELALHSGVQNSRIRQTYKFHQDSVMEIAQHPNGHHVATISLDGTVRLWDYKSGQTEFVWELPDLYPTVFAILRFSESGDELTAMYRRDEDARLEISRWNTVDGSLIELIVLPEPVADRWVEWDVSSDWSYAVIGNFSGSAEVWDLVTLEKVVTLGELNDWAWDVDISDDNQKVVVGSSGHMTTVWDLPASIEIGEGQLITSFTLEKGGFQTQARFNSDATKVLIESSDDSAEWWDVSGEVADRVHLYDEINSLNSFDSEEQTAVVSLLLPGSFEQMALIDVDTGDELFQFSAVNHALRSSAVTLDKQRILTGDSLGIVRVWDASLGNGGDLLNKTYGLGIIGVEFSPDGSLLALGSWDGPAFLVDAVTMDMVHSFEGKAMYNAAFHPEGHEVVTVGEDAIVYIWDVETGELLRSWSGHGGGDSGGFFLGIVDVDYSPDGQRIATAGADTHASVWDSQTGELLFTMSGHTAGLHVVSYSPDGRLIGTGGDGADSTARIWDAETGELIYVLDHTNRVWDIVFTPNGERVVTSGTGGVAKVWDLTTGEEIYTLPSQSTTMGSVLLIENDTQLVTSGGDGLLIWDLETGDKIRVIADNSRFKLALSPDGRFIYGGGSDGFVKVYAIYLEDTFALARERITRTLTEEECRTYLHMDACPAEVLSVLDG